MLSLKLSRTQQSDTLELLPLFKLIPHLTDSKQLFSVCEKYLGHSKLSCLDHRMGMLRFLQ